MKDELLEKAGSEAIELLEGLAVQLGVTIEQLWGVLVKQCYVYSIIHAISSILLLVLFICGVKVIFNRWKSEDKESFFLDTPLGFFTVAACIVVAGIFINELGCALQIINPEYFAFKEISELIK